MNLFDKADSIKAVVDSKKRSGKIALKSTIAVPYFKGLYRKGDFYPCKIGKGKKATEIKVKPLTGAFIISYFTCLAQDIVREENQHRRLNEILDPLQESPYNPVGSTTFLVEALIASEGFSLAEYSQGKTEGARRIEQHLKTVAEQRGLRVAVDAQGQIEGITEQIACSVLSAI
jgi:hypothetical protein